VGFAKFFKFGKKGAKALSAHQKGKARPDEGYDWPDGVRLGVFGHANAGKSVYFTVLNEEAKISKDLQISVTDNRTSGEFLKNYRNLWGLGITETVGTVVDRQGEKRFPDPTQSDHLLLFNAILDRSTKVSVVAYDYPGDAVAISGQTDIDDKVLDFMAGADGLLFFFDPKTLQAELQTQAHVASFVNMLERLAPLNARLPIPVGLVITKSDILHGFGSDDKTVLISPEEEHLLAEDFDVLLEQILSSSRIAADREWSGSVRNVLVKLREFLKVIVGRSLDFQIFFVSATGSEPQKIGTDVGRSIYKPPDRIAPIGVKRPMHWLLHSILRNRKISRLRKVAKYAALFSFLWCVVFSIPFAWHFMYLMPEAVNTEKNVLESYNGNMLNSTDRDRNKIINAYGDYERSRTVRWLFPRFEVPASRIREKYGDFDLAEAVKRLDGVIDRFTSVARDSSLWPKVNPSNDSLMLTPEHGKLLADLGAFHQGDDKALLYRRSDRVLQYWTLFTNYILNRADTAAYAAVGDQIQFDTRTYTSEISSSEKTLGEALTSSLALRTEKKVQREVARKAGAELGDLFSKINSSSSVSYRLGEATTELRKIKRQLDPEADKANIAAIDRYLSDAERFEKRRSYTYKALSIPGGAHLHVDVSAPGQEPTWQTEGQVIQNFDYSLQWKIGDQIHIALDTLGHEPEDGGKNASDKKTLSGRYALFNMDGSITFNIGVTVTIQFSPPLTDQLPEIR
jgi:hypothetical protein